MYGKANHHADGAKLAAYLVKGHPGERAELVDLRGFGLCDLRDGFRIEQIRAREGTKAEKPFFHVYFRSVAGEGKNITLAQWAEIADRCDKTLGLGGQMRAASLHTNKQTGDRHLHIAYGLVAESADGQLFVKKVGLYKNKLKNLSREIERDFGLMIIGNDRDGARGADRNEHEESRRLGTDIDAIRNAILDAFRKSDNGKSFAAAVKAQGFELAQGDRRDCFVVIDQAGGHHGLNKKLTGMTLAAIRDRLGDLDREQLPGVEQAKTHQAERQAARAAQERGKHGGRDDRPGQENAHTHGPQRGPPPEIKPLGQTAGEIRLAWNVTRHRGADELVEDIAQRGLQLVYVTAEEAKASDRAKDFAKAVGRQNRALKEGFAVVDRRGTVTRIDQRVTGDQWEEIQKRLGGIDRAELLSVAQAREVMREANRAEFRDKKQAEREQARAALDKARPVTKLEQAIIDADLTAGRDHQKFAEALDKAGLGLARVTADDIKALDELRQADDVARAAASANDQAHRPRIFAEVREGELAVVTKWGDVLRLNQQHMAVLEARLFPTPRGISTSTQLVVAGSSPEIGPPLPSVTEQRAAFDMDAEFRAAYWQAIHDARALDRSDATARRVAMVESGQAAAQQREILATVQDAKQGTIAAGAEAVETGIHASAVVLSALSRAVEGVIGFLGDLWASPSKPTELEREIAPRVAGEREQQRADAAAHRQNEAAHEELLDAINQQRNEDRDAARYFRPITRPIGVDIERDEGRERERER